MKKNLVVLAMLAGACAVAQAGDFYVTGDITKTHITDIGSDQGFALSGGYQFNRNWGAELGYRFIGSSTKGFSDSTGSAVGSFRYRAIQLSGVGSWPVNDQFSLFGRLGINTIKAQESLSVTSGNFTGEWRGKGYGTGLLIGMGVDYAFTKQLSVRAEYQRPASDVSLLALGLKYGF